MHSRSCGALLRLCEAICDYADCLCDLTPAWPSRALSQDDIDLSAATFRPGRHFRLSRHRDPAPVGVYQIVQVESSLLHYRGTDELPKEGTFCFRPALVNNGGSIRMIRFLCACVNFIRYILRRRSRPNARGRSGGPTERREHSTSQSVGWHVGGVCVTFRARKSLSQRKQR